MLNKQSDIAVPRGIEILVKKAAVDAAFRDCLLRERDGAADHIGLVLEPAEAAMLRAIPAAQLEAVVAGTTVPPRFRAAFMGYAAAAMMAAVGIVGGCVTSTKHNDKGTSLQDYDGTTYRIRLPKYPGDTAFPDLNGYTMANSTGVFAVKGAAARGNRSFDCISTRIDHMTVMFFRDYLKFRLPTSKNPGGYFILRFAINGAGRVIPNPVIFDTYEVPEFNNAVLERLNDMDFGKADGGNVQVGYLFSAGSDMPGLYPSAYYGANLKDFLFGDITDLDIIVSGTTGIRPDMPAELPPPKKSIRLGTPDNGNGITVGVLNEDTTPQPEIAIYPVSLMEGSRPYLPEPLNSVESIIAAHKTDLLSVYQEIIPAEPRLHGRMVIRFAINARGDVMEVEVAEDTTGSVGLTNAISERIRKWQFPPLPRTGAIVVLPLDFATVLRSR